MRSSLFAVAAVATAVSAQGALPAPSSTVVANPGTLPLGAECARTEQCAGGAQCFASNFMQITSCGKFNAACSNDSQCATNTCQNGICSGFLASSLWLQPTSVASSAMQPSTSATGGIRPAPSSTVVAAAGSLPLGAECASTEQCAGGAECFASTAWLIKSCGKFNAACTNDSQCATNTCQGGLCNGFLASSAYLANSASRTMSSAASSSTASGSVIPLGKSCNATSRCENGAQCAVSSAWQEASAGQVCGPFNATCSSSSQCSYNSCFNGRCIGLVGYEYATSTAIVSGKPTLVAVNGSAVSTSRTASSTVAVYTGAAGKAEAGVAAAILGAVAFFL